MTAWMSRDGSGGHAVGELAHLAQIGLGQDVGARREHLGQLDERGAQRRDGARETLGAPAMRGLARAPRAVRRRSSGGGRGRTQPRTGTAARRRRTARTSARRGLEVDGRARDSARWTSTRRMRDGSASTTVSSWSPRRNRSPRPGCGRAPARSRRPAFGRGPRRRLAPSPARRSTLLERGRRVEHRGGAPAPPTWSAAAGSSCSSRMSPTSSSSRSSSVTMPAVPPNSSSTTARCRWARSISNSTLLSARRELAPAPPADGRRAVPARFEDVEHVQHADEVVESSRDTGHAAVTRLRDGARHLLGRRGFVHGEHGGPRRHDIAHDLLAELHQRPR